MINALIGAVFKVIIGLLAAILNVLLTPFTILIEALFPGFSSYFGNITYFFNTYVFGGLRFLREIIYNYTGLNRNLVGIAILIPSTYLAFSIANASVRLMVSLYRMYKMGKTE